MSVAVAEEARQEREGGGSRSRSSGSGHKASEELPPRPPTPPLRNLDDLKVEQLYLLEVLINNIELVKKKGVKMPEGDGPMFVRVKFIDFPCIEISQEDFLDSNDRAREEEVVPGAGEEGVEASKASPIASEKGSGGKSASLKSAPSNIDFSSGKSCLFPMLPLELLRQIQRHPLAVHVYRKRDENECVLIGVAKVKLGQDFEDIILKAVYDNVPLPISNTVDCEYTMTNTFGDKMGQVSLFVRLSCFGVTIVTQFQLVGNEQEYIFKNSKKDNTLEAQKKKSFLHGIGPYKMTNVVAPLVSPNDISPLKPIITTEDNTMPLRTSCSEANAITEAPYKIVPWRKYVKECGCEDPDVGEYNPVNRFIAPPRPERRIPRWPANQEESFYGGGGGFPDDTPCPLNDCDCGPASRGPSPALQTQNAYSGYSPAAQGIESNCPVSGCDCARMKQEARRRKPACCGCGQEGPNNPRSGFNSASYRYPNITKLNTLVREPKLPEFGVGGPTQHPPNLKPTTYAQSILSKYGKQATNESSCEQQQQKEEDHDCFFAELHVKAQRTSYMGGGSGGGGGGQCCVLGHDATGDAICYCADRPPAELKPFGSRSIQYGSAIKMVQGAGAGRTSAAGNVPEPADASGAPPSEEQPALEEEPKTSASPPRLPSQEEFGAGGDSGRQGTSGPPGDGQQAAAGGADKNDDAQRGDSGVKADGQEPPKEPPEPLEPNEPLKNQQQSSDIGDDYEEEKVEKKRQNVKGNYGRQQQPPQQQKQREDEEEERHRRRMKRKYHSIYHYTAGMYPGIHIGHRHCLNAQRFVPKTMGWLWNTEDSGDGLKARRGWRPGAINRTIAKMIRQGKLAAGLLVEEEEQQKGSKTGRSKGSRRPFTPRSTASAHPMSGDYLVGPQSPTLHVHKKDGAYFISMNPLRTESEDDEEERSPLMFKILKDENASSSSSESSLEIEFTAPGAFRRRPPKPIMETIDTQYSDPESIVELLSPPTPGKGAGRKGGKKGTTDTPPPSTMASVAKDNKWDADHPTQVSKIKK